MRRRQMAVPKLEEPVGLDSPISVQIASSQRGAKEGSLGQSLALQSDEVKDGSVEMRSEQRESAGRRVFGLGARTNRLRHNEYAEKRSSSLNSATRSSGSASKDELTLASVSSERSQPSMIEHDRVPLAEPTTNGLVGPLKHDQDASNGHVDESLVSNEFVASTKRRSVSEKSEKSTSKGRQTRRKSVEEKAKKVVGKQVSETEEGKKHTKEEEQVAPRMMFTIPPPPPQKSSKVGNQSIVSYAKARIYDRPTQTSGSRLILLNSTSQQQLGNSNGSLTGTEFPLPTSIVSGFKPPKQVNVTKARARWEGGEPFARCKSRQRLAAAQAGKKLQLHGTWSMTSVVATQQHQLQQALALNSNGRPTAPNSEPPVKVLSRGSVLERVQQFEKAPLEGELAETSVLMLDDQDTSTSSSAKSVGISRQEGTSGLGSNSSSGVGQATSSFAPTLNPKTNSPPSLSAQQRRFSFRRSSTSSSLQHNNNSNSSLSNSQSSTTTSIIPRFYHPNGKPNTYALELEKRNIVACFDQFPERRANLTNKRHFQAIALASGFTDYFKEPLCAYIKFHRPSWLSAGSLKSNGPKMMSRPKLGVDSKKLTSFDRSNDSSAKENLALSVSATQPESPKLRLNRSYSIDHAQLGQTQNGIETISCDEYLFCWKSLVSQAFDLEAKFVHLLTFDKRNHLLPQDFVPLIQSIIDDHPGLKFLRAAPDFHMRYIETVIARIYYVINKSWTGKISLAELRKSNLLKILGDLSQKDDINQIRDYFSYEHFYVIYCKFWLLDKDHDLLISKEDLARHNDAAISSRIIERIFAGINSRQIKLSGKMNFSDFVWFIIAEEDKKNPRSVEYWFRLMDLDGDGYVSMFEMEYFYEEQLKRLELMHIEGLPFIDCACQILDLINPKQKNKISLTDLKRTKMATIFFDTFINLEKYLEHESREFVSTRDIVQNGEVISDWDRYASDEYESLLSEESTV